MKSIRPIIQFFDARVDDQRGVAGNYDVGRPAGVRAEIVTVQGDDGWPGADGVQSRLIMACQVATGNSGPARMQEYPLTR